MIPKLIESVCNLVISGDEICIITMISRYFQVWNKIDEKLLKTSATASSSVIIFPETIFLLTFQGGITFLICLSISSTFCVKNLFLRCYLVMISLFIFLLMALGFLEHTTSNVSHRTLKVFGLFVIIRPALLYGLIIRPYYTALMDS